MALKENAVYDFSVRDILFTPLNDDLTQPEVDNQIGGVGPFDFSGIAAIAAVTFKSKIDTGATESITIDLSGAADQAAVTVAELFAAINLAAPTDLTASAEAVTGRLKIIYSGAGSPTHLQIWGEAPEGGLMGQGLGTKILITNTMKSFASTPIQKEEETFTTTDANGIDTEVITDGYRKGVSGTFIDAANDFELRQVFEGGTIDVATGKYSVPTSEDNKIYFKIELFWARYTMGTNKEFEITGYLHETIYSAKGTYGDSTRDRNFVDANYNYTATSPKVAGVITPDSDELPLTVAEFEALQVESFPA